MSTDAFWAQPGVKSFEPFLPTIPIKNKIEEIKYRS